MKFIILQFLVLFLSSSLMAEIDRSQIPSAGPAPSIELGEVKTFTLSNGLKVFVVENHKLPSAYASLSLDNNPDVEGKIKGVSSLASSLLGNGSTTISKDDFHKEIDFMGASLYVSTNGGYASSLKRFFPRILELMADTLINPIFLVEEFDKEKAKLIDNIKSNQKNIAVVANRVKNKLSYGKKHPFGEFLTLETVNNVSLDHVVSYYSSFVRPNNAYLVIVGDVEFDQIKTLVTTLFEPWNANPVPISKLPKVKNPKETSLYIVDMPNAVQSEIYVTNSFDLTMSNPDFFALKLANHILGGSSTARLFMNLREDKGYTYGSYSRVSPNRYKALFSASASVRNEVTALSVYEMIAEVNKMITDLVSTEELAAAKEKYIGSFIMATEKPSTIANFALNIEQENLPSTFYKNYINNIQKVTIEEINKVFQNYILNDQLRVIIVGKKDDIIRDLSEFSYPIIFLDTYGDKEKK
mgnify:FL=1